MRPREFALFRIVVLPVSGVPPPLAFGSGSNRTVQSLQTVLDALHSNCSPGCTTTGSAHRMRCWLPRNRMGTVVVWVAAS